MLAWELGRACTWAVAEPWAAGGVACRQAFWERVPSFGVEGVPCRLASSLLGT